MHNFSLFCALSDNRIPDRFKTQIIMNSAVDPWVITPRERVKYLEQFRALHPQNEIVTGAQAREFFLQSQLPPLVLGEIW